MWKMLELPCEGIIVEKYFFSLFFILYIMCAISQLIYEGGRAIPPWWAPPESTSQLRLWWITSELQGHASEPTGNGPPSIFLQCSVLWVYRQRSRILIQYLLLWEKRAECWGCVIRGGNPVKWIRLRLAILLIIYMDYINTYGYFEVKWY